MLRLERCLQYESVVVVDFGVVCCEDGDTPGGGELRDGKGDERASGREDVSFGSGWW